MHKHFLLALILISVTACGGNRIAQPTATVRATDAQLDCDTMQAEMMANQDEIQSRYSEIDSASDARTMNMIFGGFIGYATSEDGSAARAEISALNKRNTNLMLLMQKRGCWTPESKQADAK